MTITAMTFLPRSASSRALQQVTERRTVGEVCEGIELGLARIL